MPKKAKQQKPRAVARAPTKRPRPATPGAAAPPSAEPRPGADDTLLIAGVGASAGGLEAFSQVLEAMPKEAGLAIVLVQHLAPQHDSALPLLLSGRTKMPVFQAQEGMRVERDCVYVIPPNVQMGMKDGVLHLLPRPRDRTQYTPIDYFLHSLAASARERAIAVILSGTASDGSMGVREIKSAGGIAIAQDPDTAKYEGMPRAAIASGCVDLVLAPKRIAAELVSIAHHPLTARSAVAETVAPTERPPDQQLERIFTILRAATGVDFRRYKRPTIERRLQRRMVLHKLTGLDQYVRFLDAHPDEVQALYSDVLIHVTKFFRDPQSMAALNAQVLPHIVGGHPGEQPIRIWIPGCSTGEEVYSFAIVLLEFLYDRSLSTPVQIFGTDVAEPAIEHARAGLYSDSIAADIGAERLRRFFAKVDAGYRINKAVRDVCIFARQDLTRDPPFSKLDLIACRNVLIYLSADLQKKLMGVFHYALKPNGFLVLGNAESIGSAADLFGTVDRKARIYQKKTGIGPNMHFQVDYASAPAAMRPHEHSLPGKMVSIENEATRIIQERYAPPGVVVDASYNVIQFRGQTGSFLEPAPGEPSMNLLKMAREGLLHGLREAFQEARKGKTAVRKDKLRVRANGSWRHVTIEIIPLVFREGTHFLVLFDDVTDGAPKFRERPHAAARERETADGDGPPGRRVAELRRELASSREYLQSIIQDIEATNEELQSANEEVLSANEELQSTNEELDTAHEELQSTNEELNTVNEELHARNEELSRVNSDLVNLLASVQIAILIVSRDLRIRRFTPSAERVLNLIPGDVGRPLGHIKPNIDCPDLEQFTAGVIDSVTPSEREVRDAQGNYYTLRIRPYKNLENRIDGAVLALFDSQSAKQQHERLLRIAAGLIEAVHEPAVVLDAQHRVRGLNRQFSATFGIALQDALDRPLYEVDGGRWNVGRLHELLESNLQAQQAIDDVVILHDFGGDRRRMVVNARRVSPDGAHEPITVLGIHCDDPADEGPGA